MTISFTLSHWDFKGEESSSLGIYPSTIPSLFLADKALLNDLFHGPKFLDPVNFLAISIKPGWSIFYRYNGCILELIKLLVGTSTFSTSSCVFLIYMSDHNYTSICILHSRVIYVNQSINRSTITKSLENHSKIKQILVTRLILKSNCNLIKHKSYEHIIKTTS